MLSIFFIILGIVCICSIVSAAFKEERNGGVTNKTLEHNGATYDLCIRPDPEDMERRWNVKVTGTYVKDCQDFVVDKTENLEEYIKYMIDEKERCWREEQKNNEFLNN